MATTGSDTGGTVYIRPVVDASGVAAGVSDIKQEFASIPVAADNAAQKTNRSLAQLGKTGDSVQNIERLKTAFDGIGRASAQELGESARATNSFVTQLRKSAADAASVTQDTVNRLSALQSLDPRLQNEVVTKNIAALQKLASENSLVTEAVKKQAAAQQVANTAASEAAIKFGNFERSAQSARLALLSFGKTAAEKFEIQAKLTGLDKNAATQQIIADLKAAQASAEAAGMGITKGLQQPLERVGMTAKATAAALRSVPAQFTDIVVSLQGGQAPLTVLLQQGGQLKDMFGGVGGAAKALGGYVRGLVNPYTVAAAAVGTLGYAYYKGSQEATEYNKALILTGNSAGTTAIRMTAMAQAVASATGATVGSSAEALTAFAASGTIASTSFERFAAIAVRIQKETGVAVAETVKQFEELGKNPVEASAKLNATTNYLTLDIYKQIKALEDQGRAAEAGALAQRAWADAMSERMPKVAENLGIAEKAWRAVGSAAKDTWDAMLGVGRKTDPVAEVSEKLKSAQERLAQMARDAKGSTGYDLRGRNVDIASQQKVVDDLKKQVDYNAAIESSKGRAAAYTAREAKVVEANIEWDKKALEFATKQEKMAKEITAARILGAAARKKDTEIEAEISNIRAKYTDKASKGTVGDPFAADRSAAKEWATFYESFTDLAAKAAGKVGDLSKAQVELLKYLQSPGYANVSEEMRQVTLTAAYAAVSEEELAKTTAAAAKEAEKAVAAHLALTNAQDKRTENIREQIAKQLEHNAAIGLTAEALGELESANLLVHAAELERKADLKDGIMWSADATEGFRAEAKALRDLAEAKRVGGAKKFAHDTAAEAAKEWKKTADKINDDITDALMRGFENGKGFAENFRDTLTNMFKTMILRPTISAIVNPVAQGITGMMGLSGAANAASGVSNAGSAMQLGGMTSWLTDFGGSVTDIGVKIGGKLIDMGAEKVGTSIMEASTNAGASSAVSAVGDAFGYLNTAILASQGKWGAAIGAGIGTYFGGPIGSFIGSTIGGWVDNAFSGGHEYTTGTGIAARFSATGFSGNTYQDWKNDGSSGFFGIGASGSSSGSNKGALDKATTNTLGAAFASAKIQAGAFADALGLSTEGIIGYTKDIRIAMGSDAAANKAAIEKVFLDIGNELATLALGDTMQGNSRYSKTLADGTSESTSAILQRLAVSLTTVNTAFVDLGQSLKSTGLSAALAASSLIDAFGGLDKYAAATTSYYNNFYSQAERDTNTRKHLLDSLNKAGALGYGTMDTVGAIGVGTYEAKLPTTRKEYRALVDSASGKLNTEGGRAAYAALVSLSEAFAAITPAAVDATAALVASKKKLLDAATSAADNALAALTKSVDLQKAGLATQIDTIATSVGKLQSLADNLKSTLDGMRIAGSDASYRVDAQAQISAALAQARSGGALPLDGQLTSALATVTKPSEALFSTFEEYAADFYRTANDIAALGDLTDTQLTVEQASKKLLEAQVVKLDAILVTAQLQLDAANGLSTGILSVSAALASFGQTITALIAERSAQGLATTNAYSALSTSTGTAQASGEDSIQGRQVQYLYQSLAGKPSEQIDQQGYAYWIDQVKAIGFAEAATAFEASVKAVRGFAIGTNYVPKDMLAQIHEGEMIVPKAYNPMANPGNNSNSGPSNAEMVAAFRNMQAALEQITINTNKTARVQQKWDVDGLPATTTAS